MKRRLAFFGVLTLVIARLTAQTIQVEAPFDPAFPESGTLGNAVVASAQGFESLYTNPAGFARGKGSFTIVSVAPGLDLIPSSSNLGGIASAWNTPAKATEFLNPVFTEGGGGTVAVGLGYSGSGLGLGLILDGQTWGATAETMSTNTTVAFVGGLAFGIGKHLSLGGAVRPMFRVNIPTATVGQLFAFLKDPPTNGKNIQSLYGVGVALDFGGIADYGSFSYGFSMTDIGGTRFYYAQDSLSGLAGSIFGGRGLPAGQSVGNAYAVPMRATGGIAYHPLRHDTSSRVNPTIELDYSYRFDPNNMFSLPAPLELLDGLHAGIRVAIASVLNLRFGYEYGRVSGGVGVRVPGVQLDAQVFRKVAPSALSGPTQGVTAGISVRF